MSGQGFAKVPLKRYEELLKKEIVAGMYVDQFIGSDELEGCSYCAKESMWTAEDYQTFYDDGTEVRISGNIITFGYRSPFYDDAFENKYTISFCPFCGEELEGHK